MDSVCCRSININTTATAKYMENNDYHSKYTDAEDERDILRPESFYDLFLSSSVKSSDEYQDLVRKREENERKKKTELMK